MYVLQTHNCKGWEKGQAIQQGSCVEGQGYLCVQGVLIT